MTSLIILIVTLAGPSDISPVCVRYSSCQGRPRTQGFSVLERVEMGVIYQARNKINGKCYVGKTIKTIKERRKQHEKDTSREAGFAFHNALRKYGLNAFEWEVLMICDDEDDLNESEIAWIKLLKTKAPNGYNLTDGGEGLSGITDETRKKLRRPKSAEHRRKIGEAHAGKVTSMETKAKLSKANKGKPSYFYGRKHTPESIEKNRKAHIGKIPWNLGKKTPASVRKKQSMARLGIKQTPEHIAKRVKKILGQKRSKESRKKMSVAQKKRYANC